MIITRDGSEFARVLAGPPPIPEERRQVWAQWDKQIEIFALTFLRAFRLPRGNFSLLDAGCGIGTALAVFHRAYPQAELFGCDLDPDHISECEWRWGTFAKLICEDIHARRCAKIS